MNTRFDVIVIGGGVIGSSVAYHLARKKTRVLVLEKETVASQASRVSAGMLAAQEEVPDPGPFFEACIASRDMFKNLTAEVKVDSGIDPEWDPCGIVRVAATEDEKKTLLDKKRWQDERGLKVDWWTPAQVAKEIPSLRGDCLGALSCPQDAQINSAKWSLSLAEASRSRGVTILEHAAKIEFVRDGNRVTGVRTPTEMFSSDKIVIAAGAWTSFLLADLGLTLPLEPVRGQIIVLEVYPPLFRSPVFYSGGYMAPKAGGVLLVGGIMEKAGFEPQPTLAGVRQLSEWVVRVCPDLSGARVREVWAGLRPGTVDLWPVMGPVPEWKGVFLCAGHYRNGVLMSPFTGRYMADGLADGIWDPRAKSFLPDRFLSPAKAVAS